MLVGALRNSEPRLFIRKDVIIQFLKFSLFIFGIVYKCHEPQPQEGQQCLILKNQKGLCIRAQGKNQNILGVPL